MDSEPVLNPEEYVNDPLVEMAWAIKAAEYASVHMNLIVSVADTKALKLTKNHGEICKRFREMFPEMDIEAVEVDRDLKAPAMKEKWREFCEEFRDSVEDYNTATMLRISADGIYDEQNTTIVPKVIYLAIESARNSEGINEKWKSAYTAKQADAQNRDGGEKNVIL